jgi:hypothetical protein
VARVVAYDFITEKPEPSVTPDLIFDSSHAQFAAMQWEVAS